ncbi:hypothetical protein [Candidatus Hakubella thermalkaliphila]|uniref:hypothetical protein n=1 Tax=Candidatus Hakubella thermalkaliphila TaxID=2754717 RepID=UPI0015949268|nr:hypothetical protein [Candidatus Hakubella thermalkaliphila]
MHRGAPRRMKIGLFSREKHRQLGNGFQNFVRRNTQFNFGSADKLHTHIIT